MTTVLACMQSPLGSSTSGSYAESPYSKHSPCARGFQLPASPYTQPPPPPPSPYSRNQQQASVILQSVGVVGSALRVCALCCQKSACLPNHSVDLVLLALEIAQSQEVSLCCELQQY